MRGCPAITCILRGREIRQNTILPRKLEYPELMRQRFADCAASVTNLALVPSQATEQARAGNQRQVVQAVRDVSEDGTAS